MNNLAVFDFDKTIFSKDTYEEFLLFLIKRSLLRSAVTVACLPVLLAGFYMKSSRLLAINALGTIAFIGQRNSLLHLRRDFFVHLHEDKKAKYFPQAVEAISAHRKLGHEILIISGCPNWLLKSAIRNGGLGKVFYIGSRQSARLGLPQTSEYCYTENKVKLANEAGFSNYKWIAGYGDSVSDIPFLAHCEKRYLVNPKRRELKLFMHALGPACEVTRWA